MGVCVALAFASCKSSESAYKKAYEKAKQQELAEPQVEAPVEVTPVVTAPVETKKAHRRNRNSKQDVTMWKIFQALMLLYHEIEKQYQAYPQLPEDKSPQE